MELSSELPSLTSSVSNKYSEEPSTECIDNSLAFSPVGQMNGSTVIETETTSGGLVLRQKYAGLNSTCTFSAIGDGSQKAIDPNRVTLNADPFWGNFLIQGSQKEDLQSKQEAVTNSEIEVATEGSRFREKADALKQEAHTLQKRVDESSPEFDEKKTSLESAATAFLLAQESYEKAPGDRRIALLYERSGNLLEELAQRNPALPTLAKISLSNESVACQDLAESLKKVALWDGNIESAQKHQEAAAFFQKAAMQFYQARLPSEVLQEPIFANELGMAYSKLATGLIEGLLSEEGVANLKRSQEMLEYEIFLWKQGQPNKAKEQSLQTRAMQLMVEQKAAALPDENIITLLKKMLPSLEGEKEDKENPRAQAIQTYPVLKMLSFFSACWSHVEAYQKNLTNTEAFHTRQKGIEAFEVMLDNPSPEKTLYAHYGLVLFKKAYYLDTKVAILPSLKERIAILEEAITLKRAGMVLHARSLEMMAETLVSIEQLEEKECLAEPKERARTHFDQAFDFFKLANQHFSHNDIFKAAALHQTGIIKGQQALEELQDPPREGLQQFLAQFNDLSQRLVEVYNEGKPQDFLYLENFELIFEKASKEMRSSFPNPTVVSLFLKAALYCVEAQEFGIKNQPLQAQIIYNQGALLAVRAQQEQKPIDRGDVIDLLNEGDQVITEALKARDPELKGHLNNLAASLAGEAQEKSKFQPDRVQSLILAKQVSEARNNVTMRKEALRKEIIERLQRKQFSEVNAEGTSKAAQGDTKDPPKETKKG